MICYEAEDYESEYPITGIAGHKDFAIINVEKAMMNSEIGFGTPPAAGAGGAGHFL